MQYDWCVFDADETLFRFDAYRGLQKMFDHYDVKFGLTEFEQYQSKNKPLWDLYQSGSITSDELKHRRFEFWSKEIGATTKELNSVFFSQMADICCLLPGVSELLTFLSGKARLAIITNGFSDMQHIRLEKVGLQHYFNHIVISEEVGVAKPHPDIFAHAHELMGYPQKERVLMVGDNPHSDILGAINFGFKTCWLNEKKETQPGGIIPDFTVTSMHDLHTVLATSLESLPV